MRGTSQPGDSEAQNGGRAGEGLEPQDSFSPVDAAVGVIVRPDATMQSIATAHPWKTALLLAMGIALLQNLAGLTASVWSPGDGSPISSLVSMAADRSPVGITIKVLIVAPILLTLGTTILYVLGRLFRGRGLFRGLFSALAFAGVPFIISAPLSAGLNLAGGPLASLGGLLGLAFGIWTTVLAVIGVHKSLSLSTGRAVATILVPMAILSMLVILWVVLMFTAVVIGNYSKP
jgi:hypothetical protein